MAKDRGDKWPALSLTKQNWTILLGLMVVFYILVVAVALSGALDSGGS